MTRQLIPKYVGTATLKAFSPYVWSFYLGTARISSPDDLMTHLSLHVQMLVEKYIKIFGSFKLEVTRVLAEIR